MRAANLFVIVAELHCFYVFYSHGIRVHDDDLDVPTTQKPLLTTTIATTATYDSVDDTINHPSSSTEIRLVAQSVNRTSTENATKSSVVVHTKPKPMNTNKKTDSRLHNGGALHSRLANTKKEKPIKNFIPSPELIVDASQSSESNENIVIKNRHHYVIPYAKFHDNSRSITATNHSQEQYNSNDYVTELQSTPQTPPRPVRYGNGINADDKLPWPYPYENTENEFKWKIVKPTSLDHIYPESTNIPYTNVKPHPTLKPIIVLNPTVLPTDSSTYPSLASSTSIYHPYEFDNIYATTNPHINQMKAIAYVSDALPYQPDNVNYYAQPLDFPNNITYGLHQRDHSSPIEYINKGVFWHTALKWLATAIPIGLVISALSPNVVVVNANSTAPYPAVRFPAPYTTRTPSRISYPTRNRNRNERFSMNRLNYTEFIQRSKILRMHGNGAAAIKCENRYLCELGSIAVDEQNATKSAHTLYKALWRLPNERSKQKSLDDMNEIFKSIQDGNCEYFECSTN